MDLRSLEKKWILNFKKTLFVDKDNMSFRSSLSYQLFYGRQDESYPEDYPHDFCEFYDNVDDFDQETIIETVAEYLNVIGIKIQSEKINKHLEKYPGDLEKLIRKTYYILKALAHYDDDLDITNPYFDNNGDLYFLLRIESGESISGGQLSLFEDIELPKLYSKITSLPPGYEHDLVVKTLFNKIENSNKSYFITGKAGTGKSTFIQYFAQKTQKRIMLTAFTGIAAINVGGQTIHSFFRFPLKPLLPEDHEITLFREFTQKYKIIQNIETIVIDEVSMLRSDLLEAIDYSLRKNGGDPEKPFGGKQILFVGDIFQLPPVTDSTDEVENFLFSEEYRSEYFFDSKAYKKISPLYFEFQLSHRQKDDLPFVEILDRIRVCNVDERTLSSINERYNPNFTPRNEDFIITLTSINAIANVENSRKLQDLNYTRFTFDADIVGEFKEEKYPTQKTLELKKFAQVILIKNDPAGRWVNGTIAKIDFLAKDIIEIRLQNGQTHKLQKETWENRKYKYDREKKKIVSETIGSFSQYPIKLAWAITIHKSQGLTFDNVIIDLGSGAFVNGQVYTALSRCRTLKGIVLKRKLRKEDIISDRRIINFHQAEQLAYSIAKENEID